MKARGKKLKKTGEWPGIAAWLIAGMTTIGAGVGWAEESKRGCQWWNPWKNNERLEEQAKGGESYAQRGLGWVYQHGCQVPANHTTAVQWYEKAAYQDDEIAMHMVGLLQAERKSSAWNPISAHAWLSIAKARGAKGAGNNLNWLKNGGAGVTFTSKASANAEELAKERFEKIEDRKKPWWRW